MSTKAIITQSYLTDIANAIIAKDSGSSMTPSQMATRIANLPSGGGAVLIIVSISGATLTCDSDTYTLGSGETIHAFSVNIGTHQCSASYTGRYTVTKSVVVSSATAYTETLIPTILPAEYQQVEYIQSTGTQYIDTLEKSCGGDAFKLKVNTWVAGATGNLGVYGASGGSIGGSAERAIFYNDSNADVVYPYSDNQSSVTGASGVFAQAVGDTTINDANAIEFSINNSIYRRSTEMSQTYETVNTMTLFAVNRGSDKFIGKVRMFYFEWNRNNVPLHNYIPCYRKSDSEAGMFDTVESAFLQKSGSGSFIAGPDVV